jgi:hypothetical protein
MEFLNGVLDRSAPISNVAVPHMVLANSSNQDAPHSPRFVRMTKRTVTAGPGTYGSDIVELSITLACYLPVEARRLHSTRSPVMQGERKLSFVARCLSLNATSHTPLFLS